jgi:hypothetical protein
VVHYSYLELIKYFKDYGNVVFECFGQTYSAKTWQRFEQEFELNNGNKNLITLQANKKIMLGLKKNIEENKCFII